jgi:hypothetical protein
MSCLFNTHNECLYASHPHHQRIEDERAAEREALKPPSGAARWKTFADLEASEKLLPSLDAWLELRFDGPDDEYAQCHAVAFEFNLQYAATPITLRHVVMALKIANL